MKCLAGTLKTINKEKIYTFLTDPRVLFGLWLLIGILSAVFKLPEGRHNNFLIFRGVFEHTVHALPLFESYPVEYFDVNHYGPLFSLVIAPFALLPVWAGILLWNAFLALFLWWAIRQEVFTSRQQIFVYWFCAHELLTALFMQQFNVAIAAMVILSYVFVVKEKDWAATLLVVIGTLVKIYAIVGLVFFFFSRHKGKYILWTLLWISVLFCAPMFISSPEYICEQYKEWFICLTEKNGGNLLSAMQNISFLGIIRKTGYASMFGISALREVVLNGVEPQSCIWTTYSDLYVILPAMLLFAVSFFRVSQWCNEAFVQTILASVLMMICLFSTGTESSGYIIALVGVVIWFTASPWKRNGWDIALMVFAFVLTSMSPSDLFPKYVRQMWVQPFALKALPVAIIWLQLCIEMITRDYKKEQICE